MKKETSQLEDKRKRKNTQLNLFFQKYLASVNFLFFLLKKKSELLIYINKYKKYEKNN